METSQRLTAFEPRDYLQAIQKHKWLIVIVALTAAILGGIYAYSYPKRYRAIAWVIVYPQPEIFFWGPGQQSRQQSRQMSLETQATLAASNEVAQLTSQRLESRTVNQIIDSAGEIAGSVTARAFPPDRIQIQAIHPHELHAVTFANATAESFVELSAEYRRKEDTAAVTFLEGQLQKTEQDLQQALEHKQAKQKQWGVVNSQADETAASMLHNYESILEQAQTELAGTESRVAALDKQLAQLHGSPVSQQPAPNTYRQSLQQQLTTARTTLVQLQARYTDTHPAVQQTKLQVEQLREQIAKEPAYVRSEQVVNQARLGELTQQIEASHMQAASLRARIGVLQQLIGKTRIKALDLAEKQDQLQRDDYQIQLYEQTYEALLQELRDRRLEKAAKGGAADVLLALQATPMEVKLWRSVIFTGMLGLVAGIVLGLLMEVFDTAIHTPDDITQQTDVDFLGVIPLVENENAGLVTLKAPRSPPAEAYRTLRSNINFTTIDNPVQTFLITSAGGSEGKSEVLANLGTVFAQAGESVILVDSDLRRSRLHRFFDLDSVPGLTSVLVGENSIEEALQPTQVENLRVMTGGQLPPNPAELLDSRRMDSFIQEIAEYADIVLFDSPPGIMLADALILAAKLESTILVAESGQVSRDAFNELIRLINRARGDILGAVLNKLDVSRSGYYYYYYYYYYDYEQEPEEQTTDSEPSQNRVPAFPAAEPPPGKRQQPDIENSAPDSPAS